MPRGGRRERATHCADCNVELNGLNKVPKGIDSHLNRCRECFNKAQNEYYKERRKTVPEFKDSRNDANWRYTLRRTYGITEDQYWEIFKIQDGVCAVCKHSCATGDRLSVDHDHDTNEVRGLLCRSCNLAFASMKEDENIIYNMLDYIKRYKDKATIPSIGFISPEQTEIPWGKFIRETLWVGGR